MNRLEMRRCLPSHVAHPANLALEAATPAEAAACLLYAAHRQLRLLVATRDGAADPGACRPQIQDLARALNHEPEAPVGPAPAAAAAVLADDAARKAVGDLAAAAELFLTAIPTAGGEDLAALVTELEDLLARLVAPLDGFMTAVAGPDRPDLILEFAGPRGFSLERHTHGCTTPTTLVTTPGLEAPVPLCAALVDTPPLPAIPFPGDLPGVLEACDGRLTDASGGPGPAATLTPGRALGRLLAWHVEGARDPMDLAKDLAASGFAEAAGEVLVLQLAAGGSMLGGPRVEAAREFLTNHRLAAQLAAVDAWLLRPLEAEEARLRDAGDFRGLSNVLLHRQQVQDGADKAMTLSRLANLFRDRLDDHEGALYCLMSGIEVTPGDVELLAELLEEAGHLGRPSEAAQRLLQVAASEKGATRAALAGAAARLLANDPAKARDALAMALEGAPDDPELLEEATAVAAKLGNPEALLGLLLRRRDAAPDNATRLEAGLGAAMLLQDALDRPREAAAEYRRALTLDPNHREAFDRLIAILHTDGGAVEARRELESVLSRAFEPGMRGSVLRRLAVLRADAGDTAGAAAALSEALALDPTDREIVEKLGDLYERLGAWPQRLALLRREATDEPANAARCLQRMANIAHDRQQDAVAEMGFLTEAAALNPDDPEPGARLRDLHLALGLWADVARDLEAQAGEGATTDLLVRLADVYLDRLGQRERGKAALQHALDKATGPAVMEIGVRLAALYGEDRERAPELAAMRKAVTAMDDDAAADALAGMAKRALEPPEDREAAKEWLEESVRRNPAHPAAVEALAGMLMQANQPEPVAALVEPVVAMAFETRDRELERRLRQLAAGAAMRVADSLGAMAHYTRLAELDPGDVRTQVVLGRLYAQVGSDKEAGELLGRVLAQSADALTPMDRFEVELTTARCAARLGDHEQALQQYDAALRTRGVPDAELMKELVGAAEVAGDKRKLAEYLEAWVQFERDPAQRFAFVIRLGDLYKDDLKDPAAALRWYRVAQKENRLSKAAAHKALEAAVAGGDLGAARSVLVNIMDLEQDGVKRAQYHFASAILVRDNFNDEALVREHLNKAIELNPDHEEAVASLEALLAEKGDHEGLASLHQQLARHYRVTGQEDRTLEALRKLAKRYEESLKNLPMAADVLRQILKISPADADASVQLAEVLTRTPGRELEALEAYRAAVAIDPTHEGSYRAIRDLCLATGDDDGAWCAAAALCALGQATEADTTAFEANRQAALKLKKDMVPREAFLNLIAGDLADEGIARVLDLVYEPLRKLLPWKQPKDLGLSDLDRVDLAEKGMFQSMALAASKVLAIPLPRLYRARGRAGIAKVAFDPPALAIGDDVLTTWRGKDLRFGIARALVSFAPGYALSGISDAPTLRIFFLAALRIAYPDYPVPADAEGVDELAQELVKRIPPEARNELHAILSEFRRQMKGIDLHGFLAGVDHAATRAGFFMANDIVVAAAQLQDETLFLSDLEFGDRLTDLCAYAVSSKYAELRKLMLQI